jgi:hypothetical protein
MTSAQRNALLEMARAFAAANAIAEPAAPSAEQGKTSRLRKSAWRRPVAVQGFPDAGEEHVGRGRTFPASAELIERGLEEPQPEARYRR